MPAADNEERGGQLQHAVIRKLRSSNCEQRLWVSNRQAIKNTDAHRCSSITFGWFDPLAPSQFRANAAAVIDGCEV